jgi:hypothetical protein
VWRFTNSGALLNLTLLADLSAGWRECKLGKCFSDEVWFDVFGGQKVRVRVSVFPRPRSAQPPETFFVKSIAEGGGFEAFADGHLLLLSTALVDSGQLNPSLPWRVSTNGKPFLQLRLYDTQLHRLDDAPEPVVNRSDEMRFEVHSLLVVQAPPVRPAPVYRDWFRRFFPGGLPELGRR